MSQTPLLLVMSLNKTEALFSISNVFFVSKGNLESFGFYLK